MKCAKAGKNMDNRNENEWEVAIALIGEWEKGIGHLDELLESHDPGKTRWLVMEVFREWLRIDQILGRLIKKEPRPRARNLLRLAVGEFLNRELIFCTREPEHHGLEELKSLIQFGGSPRATIFLTLAAKAWAFLNGRGYVTPQDVKTIAMDILRHRVMITYEAEAEERTSEDIVGQVLDMVRVP